MLANLYLDLEEKKREELDFVSLKINPSKYVAFVLGVSSESCTAVAPGAVITEPPAGPDGSKRALIKERVATVSRLRPSPEKHLHKYTSYT